MGSLKLEQASGGDLPWHALHSRPSSLQLPWTPGKDDKNNQNLRWGIDEGIDAGATSQGSGLGVQTAWVQVKQDTHPP